jgi:gluconate 5-dehydrogenase
MALITGSGQGIGFSLALGLGMAGARIVLNGRSMEKLDGALRTLTNKGINAHAMPFDVSDADAVATGVASIEASIGPIDILVNNAGIQRRRPLEDFSLVDWHEVMRVNLDSVFLVGQAVARYMISRGRVKIINIAAFRARPHDIRLRLTRHPKAP